MQEIRPETGGVGPTGTGVELGTPGIEREGLHQRYGCINHGSE